MDPESLPHAGYEERRRPCHSHGVTARLSPPIGPGDHPDDFPEVGYKGYG